MAEITAAAVKSLRDRTNLPMMDCKAALVAAGGDEEKAIDELRKKGQKTMASRSDRETSSGRVFVYASVADGVGAIVELQCESAPVTNNEEFIQLGEDLAKQLATGPGAPTVEDLLAQHSPSKPNLTLAQQRDDLMNKIREVFNVPRIKRVDSPCAGYAHHTGAAGVLLEITGGDEAVARDICMHVAAMRPAALSVEDLDPSEVERERSVLTEQAKNEGKPENIVAKMVEGRMRNYYAQHVLAEQPFVKDDSKTVGKVAKEAGFELKSFLHWSLGG